MTIFFHFLDLRRRRRRRHSQAHQDNGFDHSLDHTGLLSNHEKVRWVQRQKVHHRTKRDFLRETVDGEEVEDDDDDAVDEGVGGRVDDDVEGFVRRFVKMALLNDKDDDKRQLRMTNDNEDDNRSGMRRSPFDLFDINDVHINDINSLREVDR